MHFQNIYSQLWSGYIELGVALVTSSALQPERWAGRGPDRPRMRAAAGLQVLAVWSRLGKYLVLIWIEYGCDGNEILFSVVYSV